MDQPTDEPKPLQIPYLSEDDVKKLVYVNNLLLQEIIALIKEETKDATIQE